MASAGEQGVVLAFDFGRKRIGIATGNLHTRTASPLTTLESGRTPPWSGIDAIVADWQPARLIVGVPEASVGETSIVAAVRSFAEELRRRYGLPVETVDEAYTSAAAASDLAEARRGGTLRRRVHKAQVDAHAASLIAEQWMNEARSGCKDTRT